MPVLEQVLEQYPQQVKISFKQFPLRSHKYAFKAAQATIAAHAQGKFWEFHDLVFENYNLLNDKKFDEIRDKLALDKDSFQAEMLAPHTTAQINTDIRDGKQAGVRGTPTVFVNGKLLKDKSIRGFQLIISRALENRAAKN